MNAKIEVKDLTKIWGSQPHAQTIAVNQVSFTVQPREIFVIMGLSGSGKSTVLRCLNRLVEPTSGSILIDGVDITRLGEQELRNLRQKKLAMVFQQFALLPHRTVLENVAFGLEVQGISKEARQQKAREYLRLVGLSEWENCYPDELSGGMKQRVGLARAFATDAEILLMDEAFSALDPIIREELQDELLRLQKQMNKTVVFITHDYREAVKLADHVAFMKEGSFIQVGTPEEIASHPANEYVARFTGGRGEAHVSASAR